MHHLLETWFHWVLTGGYLGIIVLMAMESSIFPVPSEIVIPPAAFLAAQGKLSFTGVVLAGVLAWERRWQPPLEYRRFTGLAFLSLIVARVLLWSGLAPLRTAKAR